MPSDPFADLEDGATVRRAGASEGIPTFRIKILQGPDLVTPAGEHLIDGRMPPILVGQSSACDVRLADPEVSRRHVELAVEGGKLHLRDLGSTNRTFVNDVEVVEACLRGGEHIRLGSTVLQVQLVGTDAATFPSVTHRFGGFFGVSPEMQRLYPLAERLAVASIPVVIEGETGTGKEVLAESMHELGPRRSGPYVVFDCTAVPASLVEAELFGHERGAFTGATATRKGLFEQAHGGTLLIDEIGDLDLALQPKLLRAIERSEVRRLGGDRWIAVDVRILAATRRNLDREVQLGRFRDDLFHRVSVGRIELPPLRKRRGDVAYLAQHFWTELGGRGAMPAETLARWIDDPWTGNTRELRNAVARYLAVGDIAHAASEPVPEPSAITGPLTHDAIGEILSQRLPLPIARLRAVEELERRYIAGVLAEHDGSISRAAAASGIGRRYFQMLNVRAKKR